MAVASTPAGTPAGYLPSGCHRLAWPCHHAASQAEGQQDEEGPLWQTTSPVTSSSVLSRTATRILRLEPAWVAREWTSAGSAAGPPGGGLVCRRARLHLRALARVDHERRQPGRAGRRGPELPALDGGGGSQLRRRGAAQTPERSWARRTRRATWASAAGEDLRLSARRVAFPPAPPAAARGAGRALLRRTRPTGSHRASTWARTRSPSSAAPPIARAAITRCCCPTSSPGTATCILESLGRRLPGRRRRLPRPVGRAARAWDRADLELQEDLDVLLMFQALNAGKIVSRDLHVQGRPAGGPGAARASGSSSRPIDWEAERRPVLLREPPPRRRS